MPKDENNFSSIDGRILNREEKLKKVFGVDKGKIAPFTRIEDRDG